MLLAEERTAQKKQEKRGGRTDKGTFIKQIQLPDVLTFVVRLRSREKGEKEDYLAMGRGKTGHTNSVLEGQQAAYRLSLAKTGISFGSLYWQVMTM